MRFIAALVIGLTGCAHLFGADDGTNSTVAFTAQGRTTITTFTHFYPPPPPEVRTSATNILNWIKKQAKVAGMTNYQTAEFELTSDGRRWRMGVKPAKASRVEVAEAVHDGQTTFCVFRKGSHSEGHESAVVVDRPLLQHQASPEMATLWLAFGSSYYFDTRNVPEAEPAFVWLVSSAAHYSPYDLHKLKAEVTRFDGGAGLPSRVNYFSDGYMYSASLDKRSTFRWDKPYHNGFTNAIYEATVVTNLRGRTVPLVASIGVFAPRGEAYKEPPGKVSTDLFRVYTYLLEVTNLVDAAKVDVTSPVLTAKTVISDSRFRSKWMGEVAYERSQWLTMEEARQTPEYSAAYQAMLATKAQMGGSRWVPIGIMAVVVMAPLGIVCYTRRRKEAPNQLNAIPTI